MNTRKQQAVVLGASDRRDSYAWLAANGLLAKDYRVIGVNPRQPLIEGVKVVPRLADVKGGVDLLTVYVSQKISTPLVGDIVSLTPKKVIINPGAGNPVLEQALEVHGIPYEHACTLVLLRLNQL